MLGKIYLALMVVATLAFMLSFWLVPVAFIWLGVSLVDSWWAKASLWLMSLLWFAVFKPWKVFSGPMFQRFLDTLAVALKKIFFE